MNNRIALIDPAEEIQAKALLPVNTAKALKVTSQAELEQAGEIVRILKDLQDEVNKVFLPIVKKAHEAHKAAKAAQNGYLQPLQEAEAALRTKINLFLREQEVKRIAASLERAAAEANLKQQPAVQRNLAKEWFEEGRRIAIEDNKAIARAFSADAIAPPRLPDVPAPPKAEGMATTQDWKWKIVDVSLIPAEFWILDDSKITDEVRHSKGETQIPGIEVYSEARAVIRR